MRCTVLFASPRGERSNTLALLGPWLKAWHQAGHEARVFSLYDMDIKPCSACRGCQNDWQRPACVVQDDMQPIFGSVLQSDLLLLATPIYSWFCTPPMKAALDRLVYAMEKYYGPAGRGPSLLAGKALAAVTTCGYRPEKGADLFLEAMARWCKHGQLRWLGGMTERHLGYDTIFMDEEKAARARAFAAEIMKEMQP